METLPSIAIIISCLAIGYYDFKFREFPAWLLVLLSIGFVGENLVQRDISTYFFELAINIGFLTLQLGFFLGFVWWKNKRIFNPVDKQIGLGDVLFFYSLCLGYELVVFIIIYLSMLIIGLLIGLIKTRNSVSYKVPLAGIGSLVIVLLIVYRLWCR